MKIYQITQAKSYNHHQNIHRSNSVNTLASKPYQNAYSCSFKGFEDFKTSLKNGKHYGNKSFLRNMIEIQKYKKD